MTNTREQEARKWVAKDHNEHPNALKLSGADVEKMDMWTLATTGKLLAIKAFIAGCEAEAGRVRDELQFMSCGCLRRLEAMWSPEPPKEESE